MQNGQGSYLSSFYKQTSGSNTPKETYNSDEDNLHDQNETLTKGKQLSLETNRRRREMAIKVKREAEAEEQRRQKILEKRREDHKIVTEKFQRKRRAHSARGSSRKQANGTLDDAMSALKHTGDSSKVRSLLKRTGSFDTLHATDLEVRKRSDPWATEQEVLMKSNSTFLNKYGVRTEEGQTAFERKLDHHQHRLLMEQQRGLREFTEVVETTFQATKKNVERLNSIDSLEDDKELSTYRLPDSSSVHLPASSQASINASNHHPSNPASCTSTEEDSLCIDKILEDKTMFVLPKPIAPPTSNPSPQVSTPTTQSPTHGSSSKGLTHHPVTLPSKLSLYTYTQYKSEGQTVQNPPLSQPNTTSNISTKPDFVFSTANNQLANSPSKHPITVTSNSNNTNLITSTTTHCSQPIHSKIPVPTSVPSKYQQYPIITNDIAIAPTTNQNEDDINSYSSSTSSINSDVSREIRGINSEPELVPPIPPSPVKGILKTKAGLRRSTSVDGIRGVVGLDKVRDSLELCRTPGPEMEGDGDGDGQQPDKKSVRFATVLCQDLLANHKRALRQKEREARENNMTGLEDDSNEAIVLVDVERKTRKSHRIVSAPPSSLRHTRQNSGIPSTRPPRAPKKSPGPKIVVLEGEAIPKVKSRRGPPPQKITTSCLTRLTDTQTPDHQGNGGEDFQYTTNSVPFQSEMQQTFWTPESQSTAAHQNFQYNQLACDNVTIHHQSQYNNSDQPISDAPESLSYRSAIDDVDLSLDQSISEAPPLLPNSIAQPLPTHTIDLSGRTPTENEIDQLWAHVRTCLTQSTNQTPAAPPSDPPSVQSAPITSGYTVGQPIGTKGYFLSSRQPVSVGGWNNSTSPVIMPGPGGDNAKYYQPRLGRGLKVVHHTNSTIQQRRAALMAQREMRSQIRVNSQTNSPEKVTESLAEFLNAERACASPMHQTPTLLSPTSNCHETNTNENHHRPPPVHPNSAPVHRQRIMASRQQLPPTGLGGLSSLPSSPLPPSSTPPLPPSSTLAPQSSPTKHVNMNHLQEIHANATAAVINLRNRPSALSVEEDRIMRSLERLNDRLNVITLQP